MAEENLTLIAALALLLWPIVSLCLFAFCKSRSEALILTFLTAQLLLPSNTGIKLPMVPQLDKASMASFCALAGILFFSRGKSPKRSRQFGVVEALILGTVVSPIITSELNSDYLIIGGRFLPGVGLYDAISAAASALIALIPFMLGRSFLRTQSDTEAVLRILTVAFLFYSIPLLFEIRFSPQLHLWVYKYSPIEFVQAMREGGFRPMVFIGHGLLAAFLLMSSALSAMTLWRNHIRLHPIPSGLAALYLSILLVLCKSLGALVYGIIGGFLVLMAKPKLMFRVAVVLVTISLAYPVLRSLDLVPTTTILDVAKSIDNERAESLEFRFTNENMLLARAFERPLFGWGRYGRSRVYDESTGRDVSVTDGRWVIVIGQFGLVGFLLEFGLLAICVYRAASAFRFASSPSDQRAMGTLALLVAINMFDLIPNSALIPWTWLLGGALLGRAEALLARRSIGSTPTLGYRSDVSTSTNTLVNPTKLTAT
ncbi:hypothetical protein [Bradyrhizobium sp. 170]|uniref:hypothetical protein n=1 Tax=Bradyrhizobium sp. 170 TaxID=2782641 RepID=UPI001FFE67F4|nr:hypothetical protein [Bradyrhizobium sp. 170]UPK02384.1 hypothetical protein IVB05_33065 [Bradyrhizobium sp. 170]